LHCVTDYLTTIDCSLSITPSENSSDRNGSYLTTFVCKLTNTSENFVCSIKTSDSMPDDDYSETFIDIDTFKVSLCPNQEEGQDNCEVLDHNYAPVENIKPNAPCCLAVSHNSSQHHFTWNSTYEQYSAFTELDDNLKYQLLFYKRGEKDNVLSHLINTYSTKYSVDDQKLEPGTRYAAKVRSCPNLALYKGEWSDWSPEVHWKTLSAMNALPSNTVMSEVGKKVFIPLCVMVTLTLLLCYAPVKKWKQRGFIPTPAPYFHTLYSDCEGDFKSWVVKRENTAGTLQVEEVLRIDTVTKCADVQEEECEPHFHHQVMESRVYSNITDSVCDTSPGSPAEGDSGCWLYSDGSLEKDPPWYCNDYCILNSFQQCSPITTDREQYQ
uniref:Interleukin-21 receptor-like n=1 Tax=Mastacembelus armatus TaxID=205130 RepID=A0A3Q3LV57_9TELE